VELLELWQPTGTPNCLTFVKTTAIAYHQNPEALVDSLPICNSSRFGSIFAQLLAYFQRRVSGIISDGSGTQALVCASGGSGVDKPVTRMCREYLSHPCLLLESSTGH